MVLFNIKTSDSESFLYETSCENNGDNVVREIVDIWNLRLQLQQLCGSLFELGKYGPMKPSNAIGIDELQEKLTGKLIEKGEFYESDPMGIRTGNGAGPTIVKAFDKVIQDAEAALDQTLVSKKIALSSEVLKRNLENFRSVVTMSYPEGLPEWDTVQLSLESVDGLKSTAAGQNILDPETTELWVANHIVDRHLLLSDRFGKNEKTKLVGKLQRAGTGAPGREPGVSEDEKKAMMAFYFKKQEEAKQLADNEEDEYLHSSWADPKQLQRSLRGQGGPINVPGMRL